jgi:phospholipid/cholesterol/gamma-HCH transport system substrate-binding protein
MSSSKTLETLIGALVIGIAVGFLWFAYTSTSEGSLTGYEVSATFNRVDGLAVGTDVRLSGIKIGTVSSLSLDPKTYLATAHLSINNSVQLPDDSSIKITSSGILGNSYLSVTPGGSDKMLAPGGKIMNTQGSVDLMGLIGRMITSGGK